MIFKARSLRPPLIRYVFAMMPHGMPLAVRYAANIAWLAAQLTRPFNPAADSATRCGGPDSLLPPLACGLRSKPARKEAVEQWTGKLKRRQRAQICPSGSLGASMLQAVKTSAVNNACPMKNTAQCPGSAFQRGNALQARRNAAAAPVRRPSFALCAPCGKEPARRRDFFAAMR